MVIVVVSDIHLGYSNSNSKEFENFLDQLLQRNDVEAFVILGDFVDMWRRDVSGIFLEFNDILEKIIALKEKMKVYCVAGNHDFHLLKLVNHKYPLEFQEKLSLQRNGINYRFWHGWEFDPSQHPIAMELLCNNMSDEAGQIRSNAWSALQSMGKDILNPLKELFDAQNGEDKYLDHLMTPPKDRLGHVMTEVEKRAFDSVGSNEILIFGHTHRPFVSSDNKLANSGSWLSDEQTYNTYVEIKGKEIHLMQYGKGEITNALITHF